MESENSKASTNPTLECTLENCCEKFVPGTVLDNALTLKIIFGYLSPADLRRCCEVNEVWRSIADPMVFDYQLNWRHVNRVEVTITRGFSQPQIEKRISSIASETQYLENLRIGGGAFIDLTCQVKLNFRAHKPEDIGRCCAFTSRFGPMVYKLIYVGEDCVPMFMSAGYLYHFSSEKGSRLRWAFPNLQELRLLAQDSSEFFFPTRCYWSTLELPNVHKLYFGPWARGHLKTTWKYNHIGASDIFRLTPNISEIHGAPFSRMEEFQQMQKLHVVRSVGFYKHRAFQVQEEAMKSLVKLKLKFQCIVFGRVPIYAKFIEGYKQNFQALLEHSKETLEHLVLMPVKPAGLIKFPCEMPGVKQITLRGLRGGLYFEKGIGLSKIFPNVNTICFVGFTHSNWTASKRWWFTDGMFYSKEFRDKIKFLRSSEKLEWSISNYLLKMFPLVEAVEIITGDPYGDDNYADGIISM